MLRNFAIPAAFKDTDFQPVRRTKAVVAVRLCFLSALANGIACLSFIFLAWRHSDQRLAVGGIGLFISMTGWVLTGTHFLNVNGKRPAK